MKKLQKTKTWKVILLFFFSLLTSSVILKAQIYQGPPRPGYPVVNGRITQQYNVPWSANSKQQHTGIDIAVASGTPVYAAQNGRVVRTGNLGNASNGQPYGNYIVVQQANGYLHVNPTVRQGQVINQGQMIGTVNAQNHLHYNECNQAAGCQHGAYPNPTYRNLATSTMPNYYRQPSIYRNH